MYLRHTTRRKNGKVHRYWQLVRSVRLGDRVRQETVATLGELDEAGRLKAKALAAHFGAHALQAGLFDGPVTPQVEAVRVDRVRLERSRSFGDVWLSWTLWRALRLDVLCERLLSEGREEIPWAQMAAVLVMARLCEPSSELHIAERWYRTTALSDLLGVPSEKVNDDRLYRALDQMLPHKVELERHLKSRLGELFAVSYDLLLYDVTSTYFEGEAEGNLMAARGHSRDHRPDCKQVLIALVVTREGLPLGYELFAGNRVDVTTVEEVVEAMEERFGRADRIWVMDRGMVSEENLEWLREGGRRYLIGTPRSELRRFQRELRESRDWQEVRQGVEAKICQSPDGEETFLLCRSAERRTKEKAMHERFSKRILEGLERLERRLSRARRPLSRGIVERQIGRLLERNSRAAGKYTIEVSDRDDRPSRLGLRWSTHPEWEEWAALTEGTYVLRTNVRNWTSEDLWRTYVQLSDAEAAFRVQKTGLSIRPIWHQKSERVQAHILVCFLAYVLWKTLEQWQKRAGLGNSPRTVLQELARIHSADVVLVTRDNREIRLRCVVQPDKAQADLLARLGLDLPTRLRIPPRVET